MIEISILPATHRRVELFLVDIGHIHGVHCYAIEYSLGQSPKDFQEYLDKGHPEKVWRATLMSPAGGTYGEGETAFAAVSQAAERHKSLSAFQASTKRPKPETKLLGKPSLSLDDLDI